MFHLYQGKTHNTTITDFIAKVFYRIHTNPLISGTYYLLLNDIPEQSLQNPNLCLQNKFAYPVSVFM